MKKIITSVLLVLAVVALNAQSVSIPEAVKGQQYGEGVAETKTFNLYSTDRVAKELESKSKLGNIVIKAKVSSVCEEKGCWLTLDNAAGLRFFVKMKDYAFFLPPSILGKTVLLDASAEKQTTSVEELRHYAQDAGKSEAEMAKITSPKTEIRIMAKGIKVLD